MADQAAKREARRRKILENSERRLKWTRQKSADCDDRSLYYDETFDFENNRGTNQMQQIEVNTEDFISIENTKNSEISISDDKNCVMEKKEKDKNDGKIEGDLKNKEKEDSETEKANFSQSVATDHDSKSLESTNVRNRKITSSFATKKLDSESGLQMSQEPLWKRENIEDDKVDIKSQSRILRSPLQTFELLRITSCVFMALICRLLLSTGYGVLYFQSIFLSFAFLEGLLILYKLHLLHEVQPSSSPYMSAGLMLCGLKQDMVQKYNIIMGYVTWFMEDFFLFLFAFILICAFFRYEAVSDIS